MLHRIRRRFASYPRGRAPPHLRSYNGQSVSASTLLVVFLQTHPLLLSSASASSLALYAASTRFIHHHHQDPFAHAFADPDPRGAGQCIQLPVVRARARARAKSVVSVREEEWAGGADYREEGELMPGAHGCILLVHKVVTY